MKPQREFAMPLKKYATLNNAMEKSSRELVIFSMKLKKTKTITEKHSSFLHSAIINNGKYFYRTLALSAHIEGASLNIRDDKRDFYCV